MAINRQVKCINKTNRYSRHEKISHIGGDWGKETQSMAILQIENSICCYFVQIGFNYADVIVAKTAEGHKYLKTTADTTTNDNLLSLPECL